MKRILITGANSYIGVSFEKYISKWPDKYCVDTLDMIDGSWREKDFSGYDCVYHVAGIAHIKETKENAHLYYKINRDLAIETAKKAKNDGVKQFVFLSTMAVYGIEEGAISKKTIPMPKSHYGIAKYEAELKLKELIDDNFLVTIMRPPMVYGKGCKGNYQALVKFAEKLPVFPNYTNKRSMIHVNKLSWYVKEVIDEGKKGLILPQDEEYVSTCRMVENIAVEKGKKLILTKLLNPAVSIAKRFTKAGKKAFGDLYYVTNEEINSKNILFLCQFFYPEYISSATLPYDTAVALKKAGHSVNVLCGYPHEYLTEEKIPKRETVEGIKIKRVKYLQMGRKSFLGRIINYFSFTFAMMLRLFKMAKHDVIVVYSNPPILPWVASWAKMLFKTKLVFVAYDLYPEIAIRTKSLKEGNIICRLMNHINKRVYRCADAVVTLSSEMKNFIVSHRDIEAERVHVIHNWYEDKYKKDVDSQENSFAKIVNDRFVVSYFGNMGTAQDMDTILGAMQELKDDSEVFFLFAGHGNKLKSLRQFVEEKNFKNVYISEFLHGKDFQDALKISGCALISLSEGLTGLCVPSKTYSYMMQGLPLLAIMDPGDIVSDIDSGAGLWVKNGDSKKLVENIRFMIKEKSELEKMRNKCREIYSEKYTTKICTKKYVELFQGLF